MTPIQAPKNVRGNQNTNRPFQANTPVLNKKPNGPTSNISPAQIVTQPTQRGKAESCCGGVVRAITAIGTIWNM